MNKHVAIITLLFAATGLVGPLLRWATWPPSKGKEIGAFVSDLVFLIWPTQLLAVIEASVGTAMAAVFAVGTNILLFAVLGLLAGLLAEGRRALLLLYLGVGVLVVLLGLWGAGFSLAHLNLLALAIGLLLYAVPFCLATRIVV